MLLPLHLPRKLIRPPDRNILGSEVTEQPLQHVLDEPASSVVSDHKQGEGDLELGRERNEAQLLVQLGNEFCGAGKSHSGGRDETPVHGLILADGFAEGAALVVDGEGGDLLDQLEKVDGAVEEGGLEFAFEVDFSFASAIQLVHCNNDGKRECWGETYGSIE